MTQWRLHVTLQETELRDAYWEQVTDLPQLAPMLEARELRTRVYMNRPVVAFEHNDRAVLALLCRWTLDFWSSAQMSLTMGEASIQAWKEGADVYLETGV